MTRTQTLTCSVYTWYSSTMSPYAMIFSSSEAPMTTFCVETWTREGSVRIGVRGRDW